MRYFKIILVLVITSITSGGVLSIAEVLFRQKIRESQENFIKEAIFTIQPEAFKIEKEELEGRVVYKIYDKKSFLKSYAFLAEGNGYQGKIKLLCVVDKKLEKIIGIEIIESRETPGLGARISEEDFKSQFKGLHPGFPITLTKRAKASLANITTTQASPLRKNEVQGITGATISSGAVVNILNKALSQIREALASYKEDRDD